MNITITGSLGNVGEPLTQDLVRQGHAVTVISSQPDRRAAIEALGATAAIGSVEDVGFLTDAFRGAEAVFVMVPPNFREPDQRAYYQRLGHQYAQAIRQNGVGRVVQMSSWGADLDHGTGPILGSHDLEGMLNALPNVALTHLRPTSFYTNLYGFIPGIKAQGFIAANYGGDDRVAMVHPTDIAAAAAEELTTPAAVGQHVRYVASDDLTCAEAARVLGEAIGKPDLAWRTIPDAQMQAALEQHGVPAAAAAGVVDLYASIHSGAMRADYDRHRPTLGRVKIADFAQEFAAAYAKG